MKVLVVSVLTLSVVWAGALHRDRRQSDGCVDAFNNVPNPCRHNPTNLVYFPHPTDTTKFLQCDRVGRMYIVQCPQGEYFESSTVTCRPKDSITHVPQTPKPTPNPHTGNGNPCTPDNIATNHIYFAVPGDPFRFIECDLKGTATIMSCPSGLQWSMSIIACVYPPDALAKNKTTPSTILLPPTTQNPTGTGNKNPCSKEAVTSGKFFFPFPTDTHKFIQCDPWGDVYIISCPAGLIWNNVLEVCYAPFGFNNQGMVLN